MEDIETGSASQDSTTTQPLLATPSEDPAAAANASISTPPASAPIPAPQNDLHTTILRRHASRSSRYGSCATVVGRGLYVVALIFLLLLLRSDFSSFVVWLLLFVVLAALIRVIGIYQSHRHQRQIEQQLLQQQSNDSQSSPRVLLFTRRRDSSTLINPLHLNLALLDREFNEQDYEMLLALDRINGLGPDLREFAATPEMISALPQQEVTEANSEDQMKPCPICLDNIAPGDTLMTMPCLHKFHSKCLAKWLSIRAVCPMCKYNLLSPTAPPAASSTSAASSRSINTNPSTSGSISTGTQSVVHEV